MKVSYKLAFSSALAIAAIASCIVSCGNAHGESKQCAGNERAISAYSAIPPGHHFVQKYIVAGSCYCASHARKSLTICAYDRGLFNDRLFAFSTDDVYHPAKETMLRNAPNRISDIYVTNLDSLPQPAPPPPPPW